MNTPLPPDSDADHLARILATVLKRYTSQCTAGAGHLLVYRFLDGIQLSFLCGSDGGLNGIVVQSPTSRSEVQLLSPNG